MMTINRTSPKSGITWGLLQNKLYNLWNRLTFTWKSVSVDHIDSPFLYDFAQFIYSAETTSGYNRSAQLQHPATATGLAKEGIDSSDRDLITPGHCYKVFDAAIRYTGAEDILIVDEKNQQVTRTIEQIEKDPAWADITERKSMKMETRNFSTFMGLEYPEKLTDKLNKFDMVVLGHSNHFSDHSVLLKQVKYSLKPGGWLLVYPIYEHRQYYRRWQACRSASLFNLSVDLFHVGVLTEEHAIKDPIHVMLSKRSILKPGIFR